MQQQNSTQQKMRVNHQIRVQSVRIAHDDGTSEIMDTWKALKLAQDQGLDLIEVNPKANPIVCKIADIGKVRYESKKKDKEMKKNQKISEQKIIELRPVTEYFDINHKLEKAKEFLKDGDKVKILFKFKGREISHTQIAEEKLNYMIEQLAPITGSIAPISFEGKDMWVVISPKSNK